MTQEDAPDEPDSVAQTQDAALGVLNVAKPQGLTSHDVVARVRRFTGVRRVGHAGTLDPMATGVLIVCVGRATRIIEYLADADKVYRATIRFGMVTDTWDADGQPVSERPWQALTFAAIEEALQSFRGRIRQTPPMYSALKHQGQPLHRLARRGIAVEREPRSVEIYEARPIAWAPPDLVLDIACSKGTYIRSFAYDLGEVLGPGAHLAALVRLSVGPFTLNEAVPLAVLEQEADRWQERLLPLHAALAHLPAVTVDEAQIAKLALGQAVLLNVPNRPAVLCAYDADRQLVAILRPTEADGMWQPHKVLVPPWAAEIGPNPSGNSVSCS